MKKSFVISLIAMLFFGRIAAQNTLESLSKPDSNNTVAVYTLIKKISLKPVKKLKLNEVSYKDAKRYIDSDKSLVKEDAIFSLPFTVKAFEKVVVEEKDGLHYLIVQKKPTLENWCIYCMLILLITMIVSVIFMWLESPKWVGCILMPIFFGTVFSIAFTVILRDYQLNWSEKLSYVAYGIAGAAIMSFFAYVKEIKIWMTVHFLTKALRHK